MACEICKTDGEQAIAWFALLVLANENKRKSLERQPPNFDTRRLAPDTPKTADECFRILAEEIEIHNLK